LMRKGSDMGAAIFTWLLVIVVIPFIVSCLAFLIKSCVK